MLNFLFEIRSINSNLYIVTHAVMHADRQPAPSPSKIIEIVYLTPTPGKFKFYFEFSPRQFTSESDYSKVILVKLHKSLKFHSSLCILFIKFSQA